MYKAMKSKISLMTVAEAEGPKVSCGEDFAAQCKDMENMSQESFHVFTLNQKNKIIDRHMVSLGSLTSTLVHPREVLRPAIISASAAICIVHNHPSGDPEPSGDDKALTKRIASACDLMGIRLLDHVIIGRGQHFSFVDEGLL